MRRAIREWWIYSSTVPFVMTVLVALLVWFGALQGYNFALRQGAKSCESYATQTSRETKYVNMAWGDWSCMVNVNGNWIDRENVREIDVQP